MKSCPHLPKNVTLTGGASYYCANCSSSDPVNHPSHYTSHPSGVEAISITRHHNFNVGNAIKYLWRAGLKDGNATTQDLRKAIFYINDEINRIEGNQNG